MMFAAVLQQVAQVAQTIATSPSPADVNVFAPFFFSTATIVLAHKWLKTTSSYTVFVHAFPGADKWAHRAAAGFGSLIAAAGIHYTWNWDIQTGGELHAHIPGLLGMIEGVLHGGKDLFKVYVSQEMLYQMSRHGPFPSGDQT